MKCNKISNILIKKINIIEKIYESGSCCGGFDPLFGHIAYFESAKKLGDKLIVALNSDQWLVDKKGKFFMTFNEEINNREFINGR